MQGGMAGMDHSKMAGMDHDSMAGMDHSAMAGMGGAMQPHPASETTTLWSTCRP